MLIILFTIWLFYSIISGITMRSFVTMVNLSAQTTKKSLPPHHSWTLFAFSQLIQGLIDGEEEFVKAMKTFTSHQLNYLESSRSVPIHIINQKEIIFRNVKDIVSLHERLYTQRNAPK